MSSTLSVKNYLDEYKQLDIEISRLYKNIQEYRNRKVEIEKKIIDYIKAQESKGIKYNEQAIVLETKSRQSVKKKLEKIEDVCEILKKYQVQNAEKVVKEIFDAQKGKPKTKEVLTFTAPNANKRQNWNT